MKTITLNVDEAVYRRIQHVASRTGRSASELIREAMADYVAEIIPRERSIFDDPPAQVGTVHPHPAEEDDILGEMLA